MDYEAVTQLRVGGSAWKRLVIDEPQDCPGAVWPSLQRVADDFRDEGGAQLSGSSVARPRANWIPSAVVLRPRESTDVGVANLAGFVLDSVLLLSFGAGMAFAAAQERDQLLLQMGWYSCVGTSLLPVEEHALADWEGTVQSRTKEKLEKLQKDGPSPRVKMDDEGATESQQGLRYQLAAGDAALAPDLSFLSVETVRVRACPGAAAEWNALLPSQSYQGSEFGPLTTVAERGAVLLQYEVADFAAACANAEAQGALAVIFAAQAGPERPFGYHHDRTPPGIPACMVNSAFAEQLFLAARPLVAEVTLLAQESPEDERDMEEGLVSAFIANDAVDTTLHRQLKALRGERERCERSLRFARQMRHLLERNEAHCPVCFATGKEAEAFAVLPDCFHILCRGCLEKQATLTWEKVITHQVSLVIEVFPL
ncbi:Putative SWI/SNF-related matrix-associated actin-dependent regulator of chromatin subfamily A member 3-like 3 [Durusdinium trenchii]|uniref:SWI/SNF-related matrix-associated actin-dependent regulator of chromatin subfamily A member 3-like 3 n=1 Tax=Durusdinium trenchii TaxID=1381693 RepID=A0ABP0NIB5_9DINO